ncbi:MAG: hypothetical protein IT282_00340 [Bacteroidetes bacterium]|nr:hypothetical protein [Bacteroidota bacterium]
MARAMLTVLSVVLLLPPAGGVAQDVRPDSVAVAGAAGERIRDSTGSDTSRVYAAGDTIRVRAEGDSMRVNAAGDTSDTVLVRGKSTGLAMLFSAVLPGAGQAYNESYWKVPIVLGLGIYFASEWLDNNRRTEDFREKYLASMNSGMPNPVFLRNREFYKDQRDSFAWYFLILYVLNIVDAYVDASLYGFDVSPTLTLRGLPATGLTLRYTW